MDNDSQRGMGLTVCEAQNEIDGAHGNALTRGETFCCTSEPSNSIALFEANDFGAHGLSALLRR